MSELVVAVLETLHARETVLWLAAIGFYGVGDTLTTLWGTRRRGVEEGSPIVRRLLDSYGLSGLCGIKLLTFSTFMAAWLTLAAPTRSLAPAVLGLVGVVVTGWNVAVAYGVPED